jgi:hypothetical protein
MRADVEVHGDRYFFNAMIGRSTTLEFGTNLLGRKAASGSYEEQKQSLVMLMNKHPLGSKLPFHGLKRQAVHLEYGC